MSVQGSERTEIFTSDLDDGYIYGPLVESYTEAHDNVSGTIDDYTHIGYIGQVYAFNNYLIHRAFLFFDTKTIPQGATITFATLKIFIWKDESDTDFNITIQTGGSFPHKPLQSTDYNHSLYSGNGGSLDTSNSIIGNNEVNIQTNWVNRSGVTKLCLRSDNDISATPPTELERVRFYTSESDYPPQPPPTLTVKYETEETDIDPWIVPPDNGEPLDVIEDVTETLGPPLSKYGLWLIIGALVVLGAGGVIVQSSKKKVLRTPKGRLSKPRGPKGRFKRKRR